MIYNLDSIDGYGSDCGTYCSIGLGESIIKLLKCVFNDSCGLSTSSEASKLYRNYIEPNCTFAEYQGDNGITKLLVDIFTYDGFIDKNITVDESTFSDTFNNSISRLSYEESPWYENGLLQEGALEVWKELAFTSFNGLTCIVNANASTIGKSPDGESGWFYNSHIAVFPYGLNFGDGRFKKNDDGVCHVRMNVLEAIRFMCLGFPSVRGAHIFQYSDTEEIIIVSFKFDVIRVSEKVSNSCVSLDYVTLHTSDYFTHYACAAGAKLFLVNNPLVTSIADYDNYIDGFSNIQVINHGRGLRISKNQDNHSYCEVFTAFVPARCIGLYLNLFFSSAVDTYVDSITHVGSNQPLECCKYTPLINDIGSKIAMDRSYIYSAVEYTLYDNMKEPTEVLFIDSDSIRSQLANIAFSESGDREPSRLLDFVTDIKLDTLLSFATSGE